MIAFVNGKNRDQHHGGARHGPKVGNAHAAGQAVNLRSISGIHPMHAEQPAAILCSMAVASASGPGDASEEGWPVPGQACGC